MLRNIEFKIVVIAKILQIILFKLALTEGMRVLYYIHQRRVSFLLFLIIAVISGRQNKYFSCLIGILGTLIFNPFYKARFTGETWDLLEWSLTGALIIWIFLDLYNYIVAPKKGVGILNAVKRNRKVGGYVVADASVTYEFESSLLRSLKKYMHRSHIGSMQNWYKSLSPEEKKKVFRTAKHDEPLDD